MSNPRKNKSRRIAKRNGTRASNPRRTPKQDRLARRTAPLSSFNRTAPLSSTHRTIPLDA